MRIFDNGRIWTEEGETLQSLNIHNYIQEKERNMETQREMER